MESPDNTLIEHGTLFIAANIKKKRPVKLDRRKRKSHNCIQIRISGAEIIQTKPDTRSRKLIHNLSDAYIAFCRNCLGNLKLDPIMGNFKCIHHLDKMAAAVIFHQIQSRQINLHIQELVHQPPVLA